MKKLFLLAALWLIGCSPATTITEVPGEPSVTEIASPTAIVLPITPALVDIQPNHSFEGISLYTINGSYTMHWRPEEDGDGLPGHYQFFGQNSPMSGVGSQIIFLPTSAFPVEVTALRHVLADMPTRVEISDTDPGLPRLPRDAIAWHGLEQMLVSKIAYMRFQNGVGVRYITFYDQLPINIEHPLIYTFQGLTDDGQWYVSAIDTITYPSLGIDGSNPPEGASIDAAYNMVRGNYREYYQMMADRIEAVSPQDFEPDLSQLDEMVRSMHIVPTLATVAAATPLPPTPTPAMPVVPAPDIEPNTIIGNLSLYLDPAVAESWTVEEPAIDLYNAGAVMPPYQVIRLTGFVGAPAEGFARQASIFLMPTEVEDPLNSEDFVHLVAHLHDFLQQRPESYSFGHNPATGIPDLPGNDLDYGGAIQQFLAQVAYLDFQNGTGVRWVTKYTMELTPIVNDGLRYVYQGLTADGRYAVAAYFPISHPSLVDSWEDVPGYVDDTSAFGANYNSYAPPIIEGLQNANPDSFTPSLTALDRLVQSIQVNP